VFAVQFKRMLNRELTQFAESGKVGTQISEYICHTFLGKCATAASAGNVVNWVTSSRYLGVHLESSVMFKTSFAANKAAFYREFNGIFGKIGRNTSEEVLFELVKTKCLSVL